MTVQTKSGTVGRNPVGFASMIGIQPQPLRDLLAAAGRHELSHVEVNCGPTFPAIGEADFGGHLDAERFDSGEAARLADICEENAVTVHALAPMLNLLTPDEGLREQRVAYARACILACERIGARLLVTFAGSAHGMWFWGMPGTGGDRSSRVTENVQAFADVYGPLSQFAADHGVRIAFETAGRGGGEGNLAHAPELWDRMFAAVPSDALGLSFDPSHLIWLGALDPAAAVRQFAPKVFHAEAKDTEILPDVLRRQGVWGSGWWRYRLPGRGSVDWGAYLSALAEIGYRGPVTIENEDPFSPGLGPTAVAARYLEERMPPVPTPTEAES
jgi:sugar phosphate isomerase/epimerase